ncbi:MAG: 50S ribosomal protein L4 [Propionibacteriaceae bacterium]|jgi:large subunit ribosomal protein L4|nr:50S ribosomal protein L4 [Propionibacteriaceae bacterium]
MSELTIDVRGVDGKKASTVTLPEAIFGRNVNIPLIHQVVVAQLAAARQGTHSTKTRGEVRGGGIKPWRQKGTGRARQGSRRAPQWAGGGAVFGPQPRSYAQRTPKKMIAQALCSALSDRVADGKLFVVDTIVTGETPSTRQAVAALAAFGDFRSAVVVLHRDEDVAWLSLRNVPTAHAIAVDQLNTYDVVANPVVVFTKAALDEFISYYGPIETSGEDVVEVSQPKIKATKAEPVVELDEPVLEAADDEDSPEATKEKKK